MNTRGRRKDEEEAHGVGKAQPGSVGDTSSRRGDGNKQHVCKIRLLEDVVGMDTSNATTNQSSRKQRKNNGGN
ncbi:hypothetical protein BS17DRAFT_380293 [Gyrodon lividus]|nr:hypothetical protein BS17DRAFT_380293 [Gyrodon lividus]